MEKSKSKEILPKYLEELKILHEAILLYMEDYVNFGNLEEILRNQKILKTNKKLKPFLLLILNICNNHHRSSDFLDIIKKILKYLETIIKQTFSNNELFTKYNNN